MKLRDLSWKEFSGLDKDKPVIIPTGAIEVYGPHLPMGSDSIVAEMVGEMVADRLDLLITPTIPMGDSVSLITSAFPGTMAIKPENFKEYLRDVVESLIRWGFRKFFFFNTHAGNVPIINQLAWELESKHKIRCASVDWWRFIQPICEGVCELSGQAAHGHASEAGTSVIKYLTPDLVDDNEAVNTPVIEDKFPDFKRFVTYDNFTDTGTIGDATKGSAEKGKIIVERSVERIVEFIKAYY